MSTRQYHVRSLRIARDLMAAGFYPIDAEPSYRTRGLLTFVFEATPEFDAKFTELQLQNRRSTNDTKPTKNSATGRQ